MPSELLSSLVAALESLDAARLPKHYLQDAVFEDPAAGPFPKFHAT